MDLHHHTGHLITQLETMLMQTRNLLEALGLEDSFPSEIEARASREAEQQRVLAASAAEARRRRLAIIGR